MVRVRARRALFVAALLAALLGSASPSKTLILRVGGILSTSGFYGRYADVERGAFGGGMSCLRTEGSRSTGYSPCSVPYPLPASRLFKLAFHLSLFA